MRMQSKSQVLIDDLRSIIDGARRQVAVAVNSEMTMMYWHIGERMNREVLGNQRAEYGKQMRLTQKGWSLFYIGCRRVVGRFRQSSASLHPPSGTSFLREPLTRPRPATLCRSLPATTQLTSLPVFPQQVPYFEPVCAWTLLYKQHTS